MARLIEGSIDAGGRIVDDAWTSIASVDALHAAPAEAPLLVARAVWSTERDALIARGTPVGIRLEASDDPTSIAGDLGALALIAIDFPKFTDGRGYSIARTLRERLGWRGPLRAVGDVLQDQLFYMLRCGFDSFAMKHEALIDDALKAYRDFSDGYQTSVDRPVPHFARRVGAPA